MLWDESSGSTNRTCLQKMDNLVEIQVTFIAEKWERVNRAWGWKHRVLCLCFDLVTYGFRAPSRTFQGLHPHGASVSPSYMENSHSYHMDFL